MNRLIKTTTLILSAFIALNVSAQTSPIVDQPSSSDSLFENGFVDLPPNLIVKPDQEHKIVRYFIDFSCIYCRKLRSVMDTWCNTLSRGYRLVYHHVGDMESPYYFLQSAALTYVMNSDITYGQKQQYIELMFTHINQVKTNKELVRLIKEATASVGLNPSEVAKYIMTEEATVDYTAAVDLQNQVSINVTPSILIAGRYLTHLGMTDGSPERWIELINKVTSIDIYSRSNTLTNIPNPLLQGLPTKD